MDSTMMSVFGVGVSLAALLVVSLSSLRTEITAVETRLRGEINAVEIRLGKRIDGLDDRVSGLDRRVTLLEAAVSRLLGPRWRPALPEPAPDDSPA